MNRVRCLISDPFRFATYLPTEKLAGENGVKTSSKGQPYFGYQIKLFSGRRCFWWDVSGEFK